MSRIGKLPIEIPSGVDVQVDSGLVRVKGPKGELSQVVSRDLSFERDDSRLLVKRPTDRGEHKALHGLTRSLVFNMVHGVTEGFEKRLEIQGVGYRAQLRGNSLELALGYSHPVRVEAPEGIDFEVPRADADHRARHRQAGGGRDRGADPQAAPARALQGQGCSLRRRIRGPQGRQARMTKVLEQKHARRFRRRRKIRGRVEGTAERPRLSVYRSNRGVVAQLIDDDRGHTVASVTWIESDLRDLKAMEQAKRAGEVLAARAKEAGVESCVFDRGGYKYHGRVKALADGAREGGLTF